MRKAKTYTAAQIREAFECGHASALDGATDLLAQLATALDAVDARGSHAVRYATELAYSLQPGDYTP
jgi:hypothetical protein